MENLNNTMELLVGKMNDLSADMDTIFDAHNDVVDFCNKRFNLDETNFKTINDNFVKVADDISGLIRKQRKLRNLVIIGGIAGGYLLYKQFKTYNERMAAMEKELDKFKMEKKEQVFEDK